MTDTQYLEDGPLRLAYDVRGDHGPWIVLVHGFAYPRVDLAALADTLAQRCRVVTIDNRGVGETEVDDEAFFTVPQMGRDVVAVMAAAGVRDATLVGLSLGGGIALEAVRHDASRVARLVIACPNVGERLVFPQSMVSLELDELMDRSHRVMESLAQGVVPDGLDPNAMRDRIALTLSPTSLVRDPHLPDQILEGLTARPITPANWLRQHHAAEAYRWTNEVPTLDLPAMVLFGAHDRFVNPEVGVRLAERIGGDLVVLEDAGHLLHWDRPQHVADLIIAFTLRGTEAGE